MQYPLLSRILAADELSSLAKPPKAEIEPQRHQAYRGKGEGGRMAVFPHKAKQPRQCGCFDYREPLCLVFQA